MTNPSPAKTEAATGAYTANGKPRGRTALTPHIVVAQAERAIAFYRDVFGARVHCVTRMGALVAHAELDFGDGFITLGEPGDAFQLAAPAPGAPAVYSLALYAPDVDALTARAVEAGATLREAPATFVSGDRFASVIDPFGVRWSIMTRVEDLSPEESARRVAAWAASFGG